MTVYLLQVSIARVYVYACTVSSNYFDCTYMLHGAEFLVIARCGTVPVQQFRVCYLNIVYVMLWSLCAEASEVTGTVLQ